MLALVLILLTVHWLSRGPDCALTFDRVMHSDEAPEELAYKLGHYSEWPKWFHSLARVQALDGAVTAQTNALIKLEFDPHKGPSKRFEINARITEFVPGKKLSIHILNESSGKIAKMFSDLDWTVELTAANEIIGHERAETAGARARFFGRVASRILLNQTFYPDVITLATPARPQPVDLVGQ
jgi:hypothetical protein